MSPLSEKMGGTCSRVPHQIASMMRADFCYLCTGSTWNEDMGRQESLQLIERKAQVDTDAQETSRVSNFGTRDK